MQTRLSATPASITLSTPNRRIRLPVKNDGPNIPTTCEEMTVAVALNGCPHTPIASGVAVISRFMTP